MVQGVLKRVSLTGNRSLVPRPFIAPTFTSVPFDTQPIHYYILPQFAMREVVVPLLLLLTITGRNAEDFLTEEECPAIAAEGKGQKKIP